MSAFETLFKNKLCTGSLILFKGYIYLIVHINLISYYVTDIIDFYCYLFL